MSFERVAWPTSVSVLGKEYAVRIVEKIDNEGSRGACDIVGKRISILKGSPKGRWSTLFHEIAHAWLEESKFTAYLTNDDMEELLAVMIEQQFLPIVLELVGRRQLLPK